MTNADKYLKEEITKEDIEQLAKNIDTFYQNNIGLLPIAIQQFFNEIQKPTLTEDERVILRNISKRYNKVGRKFSGALYLHEAESVMIDSTFEDFFEDRLFQFIKERRRIFNKGVIGK